MKLGATRSHKRWQWEPKASGIVDAPQTLPWQQGLGWRAGMRSGLAVPSIVPKDGPGGSVAVAGGVTQRDGSRVPPTSPLPGPITRAPTCLPHSHAPKISSLNPSRVGRARLVPSGWGTQAERGVPAQR